MSIETVGEMSMGLGECPVWSVSEQALYWIDIPEKRLHRLEGAWQHRQWSLPSHPGSLALTGGTKLLIALRTGIHLFDPANSTLQLVAPPCYDPAVERFNDGRADRHGRFWVGTIAERGEGHSARLARYSAFEDGLAVTAVDGLRISNGLAFSPDDRRMFLCDTPSRQIWQFDYDIAAGTLANRRIFTDLPAELGRPDGAAVDSEGCYWSALIGCIARFKPDGGLDRVIRIPAARITMLAFGGPDLDTLFITTAGPEHTPADIDPEPLSGRLLIFRPGVAGLPEPHVVVPDLTS